MCLYKKIFAVILATLSCFVFTACGGGDAGGASGEQSTEVVVTFSLTGPAATVGAVDLDIDLPVGFVLATEANGSLTPGVVVAADTMPADTIIAANYFPEITPAPGQILTGVISIQGFQPGAVLTIIKALAADESLPDPADFVVVTLAVNDIGGHPLAGYSPVVDVHLRLATL